MKSNGHVPESLLREASKARPLNGDEKAERVARFRAILASKQLTVYSLMKKTKQLYGSSSEYFIPHNFSHYVVSQAVSPHICQVIALSRLTGYALADWLEFFGCAPDMISSCQLRLQSDQTTLLTSEVYDKNALVPFLGTPLRAEELDRTVPISKIAKYSMALSARRVESLNSLRFLYARIGRQDALGFPDLVPESIVRIDPLRTIVPTEVAPAGGVRTLYLVKYPGALTCCHVQPAGVDRILLAPHRLEFERLEFRLGREAEILGTVNAEIRPLPGLRSPITGDRRRAIRTVSTRPMPGPNCTLGELLRHSRERIGVNLRKIHDMSRQLAHGLNDERYQLSTSALWEMETNNVLPRHIEKILSVCILYGLDLLKYLRAARIPVDETGQEPLPSHRPTKSSPAVSSDPGTGPEFTLAGHLTQLIQEIPLFLQHGFPFQFGEQVIASRALYWIGQREKVFHPLLNGALVIAVDASKTGEPSGRNEWTESWERPIYLLMRRDEKYLCGFCTLKENVVTLVPHPDCTVEPVHFVDGQEAEIVGRVTAVARILP